MTLYTDLGVTPDADPATIAKAHRDAAKALHPDNQETGDRAKFEVIQRAGVVLRDPAKRKRYDETGDAGDAPDNSLSALTAILTGAFDRAMSHDDWAHADIIDAMKNLLAGDIAKLVEQQREAKEAKVTNAKAMKRLRFTGEGRSVLVMVLEQRAAMIAAALGQMAEGVKHIEAAVAALGEYGWEFDARPAPIMPTHEDLLRAAMMQRGSSFYTTSTRF